MVFLETMNIWFRRETMNMQEPPKPYSELSTSELVDWVGELAQSDDAGRMEINMALAEVYERLQNDPEDRDARQLEGLRETLHLWLRGDDDRRMGGFRDRGDRPPRGGGLCMCSIERLEARAKRGD
jgi:hypothetical protein